MGGGVCEGVGVGVSVGVNAAAESPRTCCCDDRYCDGSCDPYWDRGCGGESKRAPAAEGSIIAADDTTESLEHLGVVDISKARAAHTQTYTAQQRSQ